MMRRVGRGALVAIALMFASSAALRLGDGLGASLARASENETVASTADDGCKLPSELSAALAEREARILAQEAALSDKAAALTLTEDVLRGKLEEMRAAEAELRKTIAIADSAAEDDLARLTTVYETMKPKQAAALFDAMEPNFAAGFLGRMRPDAAAAVLAGMSPDKAYAVSAILAGRNALVPKN
ncbi:MAG: hypothetical protein IAE87_17275 [Rhodobacteraceae bacterium]|jgi:flagellar motility protein MotE (MotC chaperone)|nr:hypothetical protein [Paracoccaceae bacterium]